MHETDQRLAYSVRIYGVFAGSQFRCTPDRFESFVIGFVLAGTLKMSERRQWFLRNVGRQIPALFALPSRLRSC